MNRRETVEALVEWRGDLSALTARLSEFPFDSETPLVTLQISNIVEALERFLAGGVSANDVEHWADAVEGRDDIGYAAGHEDEISQVLFVLSTPDANGSLTQDSAKKLLGGFGHAL